MNILVIGTLGYIVLLYLLYLRNRNQRCAFALWFPLSATVAIGSLIWFFSIPIMFTSSHGPGFAHGEAVLFFIVLLICPIILTRNFKNRPSLALLNNTIILTTLLLYVASLGLLYYASCHLEKTIIEITLLDTKGKPLPDAEIRYYTSPTLRGFFVKELRGNTITDAHGHAILPMQRPHALTATVGKSDFCSLLIDTDPRRKGELYRYIEISWRAPELHGSYQHFNIKTAEADKMRLSLYMPSEGAYEPPPYPGYSGN